jgi:hypothetical protein
VDPVERKSVHRDERPSPSPERKGRRARRKCSERGGYLKDNRGARRGTASKYGACAVSIMGRRRLEQIAVGCSAWLGHLMRYIIGR